MITIELIERFHEKWEKDADGDCWIWKAATMGNGYGFLKIPNTRKQIGAHRLSYEIHYGKIDDGKMVCHSCDNPKCVKPSHLFLGTCKDNLVDMKNKDRHLKGERNGQAKLTGDKVRQMHKLHQQGLSTAKIGKAFGVAQGTAWKIVTGQRWEHIYNEIYSAEKV